MQERRKNDSDFSERLMRMEINQANHQKQDDDSFARLAAEARDNKEEILESIQALKITVYKLWDDKNRQEGALNASRFIGHGITAFVSAVIALGISWWKTK